MKAYKVKSFNKWAKDHSVSDEQLLDAVKEIANGQFEANLGGNLYKKRIASSTKGKSGGFRTFVAYKKGNIAFFLYGFGKGKKSNIDDDEEETLKDFADIYLRYSDKDIQTAITAKRLFEVKDEQK